MNTEEASRRRFWASSLCQRIQKYVADTEAKLRQVERFNRRLPPCQGRDAVVAVLQDEALDELTAAYLVTALGSTDTAALALVAADWLAVAHPQLGCSAAVVDAALRIAATTSIEPDKALHYFGRRRELGLSPTVYAANLTITACSHGGDIGHALEVLEGMAQDGLEPNEYSLVMVLQAANYKSKGLHKEAMRAVAAWPHGPLLPSSVVDMLLSVFEAAMLKAPSLEAAEEVFRDLESIGFHDTTRAYNAILNVCARRGYWEQARAIFEGMVEQDVPADARTFNALLKTCVKGGSLQAALDIYEWLVAGRDVNSPIPADIETYNILIQACHQAGYLEKALEISNWAMSTGLEFNSTTYRELIETIEIAQIWDQKALKGEGPSNFLQGPKHDLSRASSASFSSFSPRFLPNGEPLAPSPRMRKASQTATAPPLAILPHNLRPAPHDGLRVLYLDHLEDLQDEAVLASSKLKSSSWANTLMEGGHDSTGKGLLPPLTASSSVTAAVHGSGIFSTSFSRQKESPSNTLSRSAGSGTMASALPIALSRVPSRLGRTHHDPP